MRALLVLLLAAACPAMASPSSGGSPGSSSDSSWEVKAGYDRTVGKYGDMRDTTTATTSLALAYDTERFGVDFLLPYLDERGPGRVLFLPGRRPVVVFGPDRTASGPGDVTAGLTAYLLDQETRGLDLDAGAIVKFGTASASKGLGTGKDDFSMQVAVGRGFGPVSTTVTAGYTFVGKAPGLGLKNSAYGSVDASVSLPHRWALGATYSAGQSGTVDSTVPAARDVTIYLEWRFARHWKADAYVVKGYSTQSPDRGAAFTIACEL